MEMLEEANQAYEEGKFFGINLFDQSSAFDLLDHGILRSKLEILQFDQDTIQWYDSFLKNRKQYVHLEGVDSKVTSLVCGTPQGSSSGPLIWLIYTLDLPLVLGKTEENVVQMDEDREDNSLDKERTILFADDVQSALTSDTKEELSQSLQKSYTDFKEYCDLKRLKPNSSKTHFLQIQSSQRKGAHGIIPELNFDGTTVSASLNERVLGVQVSGRLGSWREQVEKVLGEVAKVAGGLKKGAQYFNFKQRLASVRSCHLSKLFYSIEVWGHGLTKVQLESLQAAQNKILRWVTQTPPRTSSLLNLKTCGLLSVRQTIAYQTLFAGLKILQDQKPVCLFDVLNL